MFWHVYFFRRICQACASLWTCFGMFISSAHLSGMRSSLDMFWHVYFFNCICQVCAALWTCFGMFISPVEPARHVLLLTVFSHLCCQVALTQRWNNLSVTNWKKKESGTWSLEWLHCKLLVSSFNLKCQYMSVYAMVGITRSKVIFKGQHLYRTCVAHHVVRSPAPTRPCTALHVPPQRPNGAPQPWLDGQQNGAIWLADPPNNGRTHILLVLYIYIAYHVCLCMYVYTYIYIHIIMYIYIYIYT